MKNKHVCIKNSISGITLIALVITIVVLLILAGVSLATLTGENGVLTRAENASLKNEEASDKEQIMLAMESYAIDKKTSEEEITLAEVAEKESWCKEAIYDETTDSTIIVIEECGHQYKVESDGTITLMLGVLLNKYSMTLELDGSIETDILTATLHEVEGNITWTNSDDSVVTMRETEGDEITVTAVGIGITTITATCGDYTATCKVEVTGIEVGDYVEYNVPYTDMYTGYEFSSTTGWRYIGKDDNGNKLLISTGIPVKLYYHHNSNEGREANGWWGTDEEVAEMFGEEYSENGYDYDNGGYPGRYAAVGLLNHFEDIPYTTSISDSLIPNGMTGTVTGNGAEGPLGPTLGTAFRASEVINKIADVYSLSLAEINKALDRPANSQSGGIKNIDMLNLFYLRGLNKFGYSEDLAVYYWIAAPIGGLSNMWRDFLYVVDRYGSICNYSTASSEGIRVIISMQSTVKLKDTDGDGVFEIK